MAWRTAAGLLRRFRGFVPAQGSRGRQLLLQQGGLVRQVVHAGERLTTHTCTHVCTHMRA